MENPTPRRGQAEYDLFKELTGDDWFADARFQFDTENKITEFEYEKFLNPALLANVDTSTPRFKEFVRILNFTS